jgi:putative Mg2+ transporter-C (MgtC) family protein
MFLTDLLVHPYTQLFIKLSVALLLGAAIGLERQWRQRTAGLRTNALVSVGAAAFVTLPLFVDDELSPTRVAAQVVSGIGFLGGGVIIREGASIRGLNTAATLWGSAAVGVLAGSSLLVPALLTASLIVLANVLLRPLARRIDHTPAGATELELHYRLRLICKQEGETRIRSRLINLVNESPLVLRGLHSEDIEGTTRVEVEADLIAHERKETVLEELVSRLSLEEGVTAASWQLTG